MTKQTEAIKLMLDALRMPCNYWNKTQYIKVEEAIAAAEEYFAQPAEGEDSKVWVDLTDEDIETLANKARSKDHAITLAMRELKKKNA